MHQGPQATPVSEYLWPKESYKNNFFPVKEFGQKLPLLKVSLYSILEVLSWRSLMAPNKNGNCANWGGGRFEVEGGGGLEVNPLHYLP